MKFSLLGQPGKAEADGNQRCTVLGAALVPPGARLTAVGWRELRRHLAVGFLYCGRFWKEDNDMKEEMTQSLRLAGLPSEPPGTFLKERRRINTPLMN